MGEGHEKEMEKEGGKTKENIYIQDIYIQYIKPTLHHHNVLYMKQYKNV